MSIDAMTTRGHAPPRLYEVYVFDLDGTIYLGDQLIDGVRETIEWIRAQGKRTLFLSNNPTKDPQMYADKLSGLGVPTPIADIVNPLVTLPAWLHRHAPDAALFVIGEEPLQRALTQAGFLLTDDPAQIDVVVASYDRGFSYKKLQIAFDALWQHRRARLVTTNPDPYCPFPGGRGEPDAAAVVAAIEACTGVRCEANLGKPGLPMIETIMRMADVIAQDCLIVGDRLLTDIAMARAAGAASAVVLTGEAQESDIAALPTEEWPTYTLHSVADLRPSPIP